MVGKPWHLWVFLSVAVSLTGTASAQDGGADAFVPTCADVIGRPCSSAGTECGEDGACLLTSPNLGVCTCYCTIDDPSTSTDEDDCPGVDNICGPVQLSSGWTENFCFRTCQPKYGANDCNSDFACTPQSVYLSGHWNQAICVFPGCTEDKDCPLTTDKSCDTTQTGQCGSDEACAAIVEGSTAGICVKPGKCDPISGLCDKHPTKNPAANVGDTCRSDFDCGEYMECQLELDYKAHGLKEHGEPCIGDEECCGSCGWAGSCEGGCSVHARNGYCTLRGCSVATATDFSGHACPAGSACHRIYAGGVCFKTCDPNNAADCRGNVGDFYGDYECRSWDRVEIEAGVGYTDSPVCEFGDLISCAISLGCDALGAENAPSDMACRRMDGSDALSPDDPAGFCLDSTSSGPVPPPPPDAGYMDGGAVDGGADDGSVDTSPDVGVSDSQQPEADAASPDAGIDVSVPADSAVDAQGGDRSTTTTEDDGGCSCQIDGARPSLMWLLALLFLGIRKLRRP